MILVDTSVWVDHLRSTNSELFTRLREKQVRIHPFVIGELACGKLRQHVTVMRLLHGLPSVLAAGNSEVLHFIEANHLAGRGIGYVDAHLLASAAITPGARLWTMDRRLHAVAAELGLAA